MYSTCWAELPGAHYRTQKLRTIHKTIHVHASHHTGHEWVEQRKRKKVVLEELEGLQDDLSFFKGDGSVDGDK